MSIKSLFFWLCVVPFTISDIIDHYWIKENLKKIREKVNQEYCTLKIMKILRRADQFDWFL